MNLNQGNDSSNYENYQNAIVDQPSFSDGTFGTSNRDCPRGLEILNHLTTVVVREVGPVFCSCENDKIYEILYQGTKIFSVQEDTDCWTHCCFGSRRPFKFVLYDMEGNGLMSVYRESVQLDHIVQVKIAGRRVGCVENHWTWCKPKLSVRDANGRTLFKIKRSKCLPLCFWSEIDFFIFDMNDEEVGKITRHWNAGCTNICSWADTFSIKFPRGSDIYTKALLIGACFLIDFKVFEPQQGAAGAGTVV